MLAGYALSSFSISRISMEKQCSIRNASLTAYGESKSIYISQSCNMSFLNITICLCSQKWDKNFVQRHISLSIIQGSSMVYNLDHINIYVQIFIYMVFIADHRHRPHCVSPSLRRCARLCLNSTKSKL